VSKQEDGTMTVATEAGQLIHGAECLIWAIGRHANIKDLNLQYVVSLRPYGFSFVLCDSIIIVYNDSLELMGYERNSCE